MHGDDDELHIVFYVSGHGLGHVTRCAEVARALLSGTSGSHRTTVTFVTGVANCAVLGTRVLKDNGVAYGRWGISHALQLSEDGPEVLLRDKQLDAGATQKDAFCIDVEVTRNEAIALHRTIDGLIEEEIEWLQRVKPGVVVSDVAGLAFPAARGAGVPSVLMSNFSWGFIYRPFITGHDDVFREVVEREEEMLGEADVFLRLRGWSAFGPRCLESRAVDVPLIARQEREGRVKMRERYGIDAGAKVCLVMVGGHALGVGFDWHSLRLGNDDTWVCFVTRSVLGEVCEKDLPSTVRVVPPTAYIPDFVGMVDVVIGKIGYGSVSECLSSGTPLVFVPRENFSEEKDIRSLLERQRAGLEMSREMFLSGKWGDALNEALCMRSSVVPSDNSGAQIAAQMITSIAAMDRSMRHVLEGLPRDGIRRLYADVLRELLDGRFARRHGVFLSRAPARLDVLGGIADYSGSHVLEMPLGLSTFCATQCNPRKGQDAADLASREVCISVSSPAGSMDRSSYFEMSLGDILDIDPGTGIATSKDLCVVRSVFERLPKQDQWVAYIIGAFAVLARRDNQPLSLHDVGSVHILISSNIPEGAGISSSAAVEVSSICSVGGALGLKFEDVMEVPILAQQVENYVVGACCGIMDQATSFLGQMDKITCLKCADPCVRLPDVAIPPNMSLVGVHTGVKRTTHSNAYTRCRVGAFMGRAIQRRFPERYGGIESLPHSMSGNEFMGLGVDHGDPATTILEQEMYHPRECASYPQEENKRVLKAIDMMNQAARGSAMQCEDLKALGEMLYESHEGYSRCSLGCREADELVRLCKQRPDSIYGCRISGGGEGGTACILMDAGPAGRAAVEAVLQEYAVRTGQTPTLFEGTSNGAAAFGIVQLVFY